MRGMMRSSIIWILATAASAGMSAPAVMPTPSPSPSTVLAGTSWQLVRFQGGDDTVMTPDDRSKYTMQFTDANRVAVRFDCNRGNGSWTSMPPQLQFGPMAMTRAFCGAPSLHDRMVTHWPLIRSYVIRDGHLFLSLMADGGIYEFEPHLP